MSDPNETTVTVEDLGLALLSLSRETWVLKDRMMMLEDILQQSNVVSVDKIKGYVPTAARQAEIDKACHAMMADILESIGL